MSEEWDRHFHSYCRLALEKYLSLPEQAEALKWEMVTVTVWAGRQELWLHINQEIVFLPSLQSQCWHLEGWCESYVYGTVSCTGAMDIDTQVHDWRLFSLKLPQSSTQCGHSTVTGWRHFNVKLPQCSTQCGHSTVTGWRHFSVKFPQCSTVTGCLRQSCSFRFLELKVEVTSRCASSNPTILRHWRLISDVVSSCVPLSSASENSDWSSSLSSAVITPGVGDGGTTSEDTGSAVFWNCKMDELVSNWITGCQPHRSWPQDEQTPSYLYI